MRAIRCLVAAVLAAGIVTVVSAQPRPGGGFGSPDVESLVFTNAALQEEIKVTAEQAKEMKPISEKMAELDKKRGEIFSGGKFDKDKFTEIQDEGKKVAEERKKVAEKFTDAQKKRIKQIQTQVMTFSVFNDPEAAKGNKGGFGGPTELQKSIMKEVQETLKLSDSQKSSIKGITGDFNKERQEIFKDSGVGFGKGAKFDQEKFDAANKKVEKARKEAWGKVEELLDENQKKAWKGLVGDAFDASKLRQPRKD